MSMIASFFVLLIALKYLFKTKLNAMKKILLAVTVSVFVCSVDAQIKKGSIFLGGDIGGSTLKTKTTNDVTTNKQNIINVSPVFGKAIKDNLVLGGNATFGIYDDNYLEGDWRHKTHSYGAGVFLRKYKSIGTGGFYLFVQGALGGTYTKQEQEGPDPGNFGETKRIAIGVNAYPGISYAISRKLHLETGFNNLLSLNYSNEKRKIGSPVINYKANGFSISSSLSNATSSLYLGFRLLIGE